MAVDGSRKQGTPDSIKVAVSKAGIIGGLSDKFENVVGPPCLHEKDGEQFWGICVTV